jgi:hypothetical protein
MERRTKAQLEHYLAQSNEIVTSLRKQNDETLRDYHDERERFARETAGLHDHILVLQGDRDRLTATIEILSRRLASPYADKDPIRGGWRWANQLTDQKATR